MNDSDIRDVLIKKISMHKSNSIHQEQYTADGSVRADVLEIGKHLNAYEIKSDVDTLRRLPRQIEEYDLNFEINSIVTTKRYQKQVTDLVPEHWGVLVVREGRRSGITIDTVRRASLNPKLDWEQFVGLLDGQRLKRLVNRLNLNDSLGVSKTQVSRAYKYDLIQMLSLQLSATAKRKLTQQVRESLKTSLSRMV